MHPSPGCFLRRVASLLGFAAFAVASALEPSPVPDSWRAARLQTFTPPDLLADLRAWAPQSPDVALLQALDALQDDSLPSRAAVESLDSLAAAHPDDPLLLWAASRQLARTRHAGDTQRALGRAQAAAQADPGNALLDMWQARLLARLGDAPRARMLFYESRAFARADAYGRRFEAVMLRALQQAGRLNAFSLVEASALHARMVRRMRLVDAAEDADVLREVFLDPLAERPYDIRRRAPEAALRWVWVGQALRRSALDAPGIFYSGLEDRVAGYAFEAKGWEFLREHARAFARPAMAEQATLALARLGREAETVLDMAIRQWQGSASVDFLGAWQIRSADAQLTLGEALLRMQSHPLWLRVLRLR